MFALRSQYFCHSTAASSHLACYLEDHIAAQLAASRLEVGKDRPPGCRMARSLGGVPRRSSPAGSRSDLPPSCWWRPDGAGRHHPVHGGRPAGQGDDRPDRIRAGAPRHRAMVERIARALVAQGRITAWHHAVGRAMAAPASPQVEGYDFAQRPVADRAPCRADSWRRRPRNAAQPQGPTSEDHRVGWPRTRPSQQARGRVSARAG
jgi:hypothetical protein